ncbi:phage capsid scaffolding protein [Buttiauxella brennerae ATCC 51605]|uniref:Phage capsid scaffolding protein n=1 Tax=Buttiauxella brennerae ATCC 51605 TaxID=1354251 RepID=A0A1B7IQU0_9ENTR|nr:GPO family capsid scaffolding protein [Buttiauxella brennerae]OAT32107.1 phage capsid scaffolding protein [Buttiauxella brennerae ATCC 51605]
MAKKAKRFRIGVEGATTDGRKIERSWLTQMAANYDPATYTATINMEHIKGYTADSPFRRYGIVDKLEAVEIADGALAGKMALYATITPTDDLVAMTAKMQKLFTSMEVNPEFADTGEAYLVGLAVTDDPASLGTEILQFSAGASRNPLASRKLSPDNLFSAAEETLLEFEDIADPKPSLFSVIKELFAGKQTTDDARFGDVHKAVGLVAEEHQNLSGKVDKQETAITGFSDQVKTLEEQLTATQDELATLRQELSTQDNRTDRRKFATGGNQESQELTNC